MTERILCNGTSLSVAGNPNLNFPFLAKKHAKRQTIRFANPVYVAGRMSVVGTKEGKGPLGPYFHVVASDDKMNEKTFEQAEIDMLKLAIDGAVQNAGIQKSDAEILIGGDLLNQITSSAYVAREYDSCFLGLYSACSTMSEGLAMGGILIDGGYFQNAVCSTASHFATAERQFRFPLEYGCQRPPYAQWTVTGAGSIVLSSEAKSKVRLTTATFGKIIDFGIDDLNNMGAAMAPAAMNTLQALFLDTNTSPNDYDLIVTGDLGKLGSDILRELMREKGYFLGKNYIDCGCMMYDATQRCYQGGSGAGCSAAAVSSFVLQRMEEGRYAKVAYLATGALMSCQSCYQGETIPAISHAVVFEKEV